MEVFSWEEVLPFRRPGGLYGIDQQAVERAWICYVDDGTSGFALKSSTIIVVSKETGCIIYAGSADDEG
jgi:hypothetical protein